MKRKFVTSLNSNPASDTFVAIEEEIEPEKSWLSQYNSSGELLSQVYMPADSRISAIEINVENDTVLACSYQKKQIHVIDLRAGKFEFSLPWNRGYFGFVSNKILTQDPSGETRLANGSESTPLGLIDEIIADNEIFRMTIHSMSDESLNVMGKQREYACKFNIKRTGLLCYTPMTVISSGDHLLIMESGGAMRCFSLLYGKTIFEQWPNEGWHYTSGCISADGRRIVATKSNYKTGKIMNFEHFFTDGSLLNTVPVKINPPNSAFVKNGELFVSGTREIYSTDDGSVRAVF